MRIVTADTETFFSDDYTLSSLTTEEYVRDIRFKLHMVGIKEGAAPAQVYRDPPTWLSDCAVVGHHQHFDCLIYSHWYGIRPKFIFDTLSMARLVFPHAKSHSLGALSELLGLGKKDMDYTSFKGVRDLPPELYNCVAAGCIKDIELTHAIAMKLLPLVPKDELRLIDMTVRMFTEPTLRLDRPRLEWYAQAVKGKKQELLDRLGVDKKVLSSNDKFAELLRSMGEEPEYKKNPKGELIYAFAKNDDYMRSLLDGNNEALALVAEARVESKSTGAQSRAERLLGMDSRGPLCVYLNYCGAHTTRDSGGDLTNFQNMKRIDFGPDKKPLEGLDQRGYIRLSLLAPEGYQIVVVDSSQIECRLLNWFAGQDDVVQKFRDKVDIYSQLASMFYGFEVTKKNVAERGTGKQLELSCGYGAGAATICTTAKLGIYGPPVILTPDQGRAARDLYRATHPEVVALWKYASKVVLPCLLAGTHDFMWGPIRVYGKRLYGPGGTWLDYSNLGYDGEQYYVVGRQGKRKMYGAKLIENVIQWLARILVFNRSLIIGQRYRVVLRTHDEAVYLARTAEAPEALAWGLEIMKQPEPWCPEVPLDAEGGFDVRYSK